MDLAWRQDLLSYGSQISLVLVSHDPAAHARELVRCPRPPNDQSLARPFKTQNRPATRQCGLAIARARTMCSSSGVS